MASRLSLYIAIQLVPSDCTIYPPVGTRYCRVLGNRPGPELLSQDPEELVEDGQFRPPVSPHEYTELLRNCEVLHQQVLP
jgi:hypothetical protein